MSDLSSLKKKQPKPSTETQDRKKIIADLTSTQCRKKTWQDSPKAYTKYMHNLIEYYNLFEKAAVKIERFFKQLNLDLSTY
jgi:hypothetical protein